LVRNTYIYSPLKFITFCVTQSLIIIIITGIYKISPDAALGLPYFPSRVIIDDHDKGIDVTQLRSTGLSDKSVDILTVTYYSTGKTLNATFWLQAPFKKEDPPPHGNLYKKSYGMFIDTDFDKVPNFRIEVQKFQNHTWTKVAREFEPQYPLNLAKSHRFFDIHRNYSDFYRNNDRYVDLTFDLGSIGYPEKYEILFYTEQRIACQKQNCKTVIYDFTDWILIPPPRISLSISPNPLSLRPGEEKPVDVEVNSTWDFTLSAMNQTNVIVYLNGSRSYSPLDGMAIVPISVKIRDIADSNKYPLSINASATVTTDSLYKIKTTAEKDEFAASNQPRQIISEHSRLIVDVQNPYTLFQLLANFNDTVITPISGIWTFLAGVVAVVTPLVIRMYSKKQKKK
jgi:hypothetical protein